jgi:5-methylcytosine-specific restriction endonuclease McrA
MKVESAAKKKKPSKFYLVPFTKLPATKAWKLTSEYVRRIANGICYTCNRKVGYEKLVAGHFIEKRGGAATYFDLDNLRAQCGWYCNRMQHGAKTDYTLKLIAEIGMDRVVALKKKAQKSKQWNKAELGDIEEEVALLLEIYYPAS